MNCRKNCGISVASGPKAFVRSQRSAHIRRASFKFSRASSKVFPWVFTPGISSTHAAHQSLISFHPAYGLILKTVPWLCFPPIGGVSSLGGCIWTAFLDPGEYSPTTGSGSAYGCADPISASIVCGDVLDGVPEIRTVEGRFFVGDHLSTRDRRSLGTEN